MMNKNLVVVVGPTGVGKTAVCIELAKSLDCEIISADSRQIYRDIPIGTASPTEDERKSVPHHFIGMLSLDEYFSAARYEEMALAEIERQFKKRNVVLLTGGSMMYVDALCKGIDDIPSPDREIRDELMHRFETEGLDSLRHQLKILDPEYYNVVDLKNPKRVIHGLEICLMTGRTYTSFRTNICKKRPFNIIKVGLRREREELYERINQRVDQMILAGLVEEARKVYPFRSYNALNTVGYKELFEFFDGVITLDEAVNKIKRNSRVYSRKQMTWFKRDESIHWFNPAEIESIQDYIANARSNDL
ncbi:MAG: tRNA (adenosine(37)-N6)-dimethylallyltransferase MiaA [Bacteroidales bacterium]